MVPFSAYWRNLELARRFRHLPGAIVECGVWRGGMSAGLTKVLGRDRSYYLLDSFEGLPAPKEIDGQAAKDWAADRGSPTYFDNCRAEQGYATEAMLRAGVTNARFVKGWFDQTLPTFDLKEPIAVLRLDGDWYDSTLCCLRHLYDRVAPGGLIIIDDYSTWEGCTRAVHDFLAEHKAGTPICQFENQLAYIIKR